MPRDAQIRSTIQNRRITLPLDFRARVDFMLERKIANPKDRADHEKSDAANPFVIDVGAVGRIQIQDAQPVVGQFDQAMRP